MQTKFLLNDEFIGQPPTKRALAYLQSQREKNKHIAGIYCGYAPVELFYAMDIIPAVLCAFANATIETAENILPANLCPLIKSSYGFIIKDTCPFFSLSEAVVAETTCDGKKKMFELIADKRPMHIMDLPQLADEPESLENWIKMIKKLQSFLENTFNKKITDAQIEQAIVDNNKKNKLIKKILEFGAYKPSVIDWTEMLDIIFLAIPASASDLNHKLEEAIETLEKRVKDGYSIAPANAPRILITGSPLGGDSTKIYKLIRDAGGIVSVIDSCVGIKPFNEIIQENTGDPVRAIAERYLKIPCACMTPNPKRLDVTSKLIDFYKPDAVIDVVLQACHGYNVESYKIGEYVEKKHNLKFLKIVTDYSQNDIGQLKTRIEALLESI